MTINFWPFTTFNFWPFRKPAVPTPTIDSIIAPLNTMKADLISFATKARQAADDALAAHKLHIDNHQRSTAILTNLTALTAAPAAPATPAAPVADVKAAA